MGSIDDSLCQPPEQETHSDDEEKMMTFVLVSFCIRIRRHIPVPILRALVTIYFAHVPALEALVPPILAQAVLLCDDLLCLPAIADVFIAAVSSHPNPVLLRFLAYIIESGHMLAKHPHFISKLLAPLTDFVNTDSMIDLVYDSILSLLRTWPGFFCLVLQNNAARNLMDGLKTNPNAVLRILKGILLLDGPPGAATDPFCGFAFEAFKQAGLLKKLSDAAATNREVRFSGFFESIFIGAP
jgi:hypothetical protein